MTDLRFEKPRVERVELSEDGSYGKYTVAPLQRGYGTTLGNSLRRMMLSSLSVDEIQNAILSEDVNRIKSVKGIGLKSAQRLILELKDKLGIDGMPLTTMGVSMPVVSSQEMTDAIEIRLQSVII